MARSMTGFGHAVVSKDGRELSIELKSVNHRFLDLAFRMPRSLAFLEDTARNTLGTMLARGHVDIFANYRNTRNDSKKHADALGIYDRRPAGGGGTRH